MYVHMYSTTSTNYVHYFKPRVAPRAREKKCFSRQGGWRNSQSNGQIRPGDCPPAQDQ